MEVLHVEPWSWILLSSEGHLFLDINVSQGPVSWSLLIELDETERAEYQRHGRAALSQLAEDVQQSAPLARDSTSPYRARDLEPSLGKAVTQAVTAWRAANEATTPS